MQNHFETENAGQLIRGTVYRSDLATGRAPVAIFLHGFTGTRIEPGFMFVRMARALNAQGIHAVTFDFRGSGESDGSFEEMLVSSEISDALKVTQWAEGQSFVDRSRIGVIGFSLGGLIGSALTAKQPGFKARVLIAPSTAHNLCRLTGDRDVCKPPISPVVYGTHTLHEKFFEDIRQFDGPALVTKCKAPTLVIQGTADKSVPPAVSQQYTDALSAAGIENKTVLIPDADHVFSSQPWQRAMIAAVVDWLPAQLKNSR
jgi:dipeptidyl aminopeptidase/acylaminoacyl peptidase